MFDALYPPGHQWYWRADFVNELSDEAIARAYQSMARRCQRCSRPCISTRSTAPPGRVERHDTAWSYREATWAEVIVGVDPDPANAGRIKDWTVGYWEALHPYSAGGAYVNFMMDEGQERVRATYRDNYDRLVAVKNQLRPDQSLPRQSEHQAIGLRKEKTMSSLHTQRSGRSYVTAVRTALETSDAQTIIDLFADDAELQVIDHLHPPSNPQIFRGREAIAGYWSDICSREMTHTVERVAHDGDTLAYSEACRYPDGTRVQCIAVLDLLDGKIARQVGVQTWDA